MEYPPCLNPRCKSHGHSHPNCGCYPQMAEGGGVAETYCSKERDHAQGCEYYAEGGQVDFTPDPPAPTSDSISFTPDDQFAAKQEKYGSLGQQAATIGEGLAKGVAGPLATLAEKAAGVPGEDIEGRAEANPTAHAVSEGVGFIAPALLTGGESALSQAGAIGAAGKAVVEGLGLQGAKKAATRLGVESALLTLGDEVSKAINGDPNSIQTAAIHVGLSGLIGAVTGLPLGAASEAWTSKFGSKAEAFVRDFSEALKGETTEGQAKSASILSEGPFPNFPPAPGTPLLKAVEEEASSTSAGARLAKAVSKKASDAASSMIAEGAGAMIGHATGIPGAGLLGALFGEHSIKPLLKTVMPSIIEPLLNTAASGGGLRAAFEAVNAIARGEALAAKATKGLFETGAKELSHLVPDDSDIESLKAHVAEAQQNPSAMVATGGDIGHYLPAHNTALAQTAQNAITYLVANKPNDIQQGPLDRKIPPSASKEADYNRTLQIAEQPLIVLNHLKQGTLKPKDVQDLKIMYPALYPSLVQKVHNSLIDHLSKDGLVPFKLRSGLSHFLGQPVDSNLTPASIMAAQASYMVNRPAQQPQGEHSVKKGTSRMGKASQMAQTPSQARQMALEKA